jgi:hypothetical protein
MQLLVTRTTQGRPKGYKPPKKLSCRSCGLPTSSFNPSNICSSCNGGTWEDGSQLPDVAAARLDYGVAA